MIKESAGQIAVNNAFTYYFVSKVHYLSTVYYALDKVGVKGVENWVVKWLRAETESFCAWTFWSADEQAEWSKKAMEKQFNILTLGLRSINPIYQAAQIIVSKVEVILHSILLFAARESGEEDLVPSLPLAEIVEATLMLPLSKYP